MKIKERLKFLMACFLILSITGCYEEKAKEAASRLQIGMNKNDFDYIFRDLKFLKKQTVLMYPNSSEEKMRATLWNHQHFEQIHPNNLIDLLTFDGSINVYSYLIRKEKVYANPTFVDYIAVFFDRSTNKIIGWGQLKVAGDVETWPDSF